MYKVYHAGTLVKQFVRRKEALSYIKEALSYIPELNPRGHGYYELLLPSGKWYDWSKGKNRPPPPNIPHTPWFLRKRPKDDGLAIIENGTEEGSHIAECEWHIAEFIVKTVNRAYPTKGE